MRFLLILFVVAAGLTSCSGIGLPIICDKEQQTAVVLPFQNDLYNSHVTIENLLIGRCYNVVNGQTLLNDCSMALHKNFDSISLEEFSDFARSRGVDIIVYGNTNVVWLQGTMPGDNPLRGTTFTSKNDPFNKVSDTNNIRRYGSSSYDVNAMITGNYVEADCYCIFTNTGETKQILRNYKVKKLGLGTASTITNRGI